MRINNRTAVLPDKLINIFLRKKLHKQICRHTVEAYAKAAYGDLSFTDEDREILIRFWQCECYGQIVEWLSNDMKYDIQAQFDRLCTLYRSGFDAMVTQSLGYSILPQSADKA